MTHNQTTLNDIWWRWPEELGPKPSEEHRKQVDDKGLKGLDALKAMMMLRPTGASQAELNAACKAYSFDGWRGCCCGNGSEAGCPVHDALADDADPSTLQDTDPPEWQCLIIGPDGNGFYGVLVAESTSHAFEEASYEFDGTCVAVRRTG